MPEPVRDNQLGRVLPFPITPAGGELAGAGDAPGELATPAPPPVASGPVLDGEIVEEHEFPRSRQDRLATVLASHVLAVHRHPGARVAGLMVRPMIRHGYVAAHGHMSWARRAFAAATHGVIREQIRHAHAAGDVEALAAWQDRLHHARDVRHTRLRNLPTTITRAVLGVLVVVTMLAGILVAAGVAFELTPGSLDWDSWWALLADIGGVLVAVLALAIHALLWAAGPLWLYAAWREGRRAASVPVWLVSPAERAQDIVITADAITAALAAIKITALAKSIQAGVPLAFLVPPREQGGGTYCQVRLPIGVMAADVLGSSTVERLAANLHRHKHEVWPQRDPNADAAVLDL